MDRAGRSLPAGGLQAGGAVGVKTPVSMRQRVRMASWRRTASRRGPVRVVGVRSGQSMACGTRHQVLPSPWGGRCRCSGASGRIRGRRRRSVRRGAGRWAAGRCAGRSRCGCRIGGSGRSGRRAAGGWGWWRSRAAGGASMWCGGCRPSGGRWRGCWGAWRGPCQATLRVGGDGQGRVPRAAQRHRTRKPVGVRRFEVCSPVRVNRKTVGERG